MSGRGRGGRGGRGGTTKSFTKEQLTTLCAGTTETPSLVTQPPPLYPILDKRPLPLTSSHEMDYLLILRQDFIDHMELSGAYLKMPESKSVQPEQEIDKLVAQITGTKEKFDWNLFPPELRPKMFAKRLKTKNTTEVNIEKTLNLLEKLEEKLDKVEGVIKKEVDPEDDEENIDLLEGDEEMDDGTDYANNYFDNGEGYEDEDDNLEDGPIY